MKSPKWIKVIGIVTIVLGAMGLLSNLGSMALLGSMKSESFPMLQHDPGFIWWKTQLTYIGIAVNGLYLTSGIFFLLKKSFSLSLIYLALTLSILYQILPMVFLGHYDSEMDPYFSFLPEKLFGPVLDVFLIIGVFMVAENYFKTPEEIRQELGENYKEKKLNPRRLKILTSLGVTSLLFPLYLLIVWGFVSRMGADHFERLEYFYSYMPPFLKNQFSGTYLSVAFTVAGIILSSIGLKLPGIFWKILNILVLTLSILLLYLFLFSLM